MEDKILRIQEIDTEADTCRKEVTPKLKASKWTDEQILEQRYFTNGRIIVIGRIASRKNGKRADYILRYTQNYPIAVVEAKKKYKKAGDGMQQAKEYAQILGLKFAYSTNGSEIKEYDFITGIESEIKEFPTAEELYNRLNETEQIQNEIKETLLKPFRAIPGKELRYYQINAINKAVKAILEGRKRALLTLATGTGKTTIAFQIIYKLWNNRWNNKGENRKPKILFLADRSVLITDPHAKEFSVFGDARCLVPEEGLKSSREVFFSTYQSLAEDKSRLGAFRDLSRDFFDLILIDECHRGSADDDSNWRKILEYFNTSVQIGLTATPLRDDNKDTYAYFGNPLYTYTLKQGIEDGFLAPYIVHRVITSVDALGWRPQEGERDSNNKLIPDENYYTADFENTISFLPRTKAAAKYLFNFMVKNGRFDKTIVFCVNQEHADQFRQEISNLNSDLMIQYPDYAVRIVSDEGDTGKGKLDKFMDIDEEIPVIVTTSRLLSTGVDIPTCKNIVLFRLVNSMTEFKQIIGRGSRVRADKEKLFFTIIDFTGSASRNFADPDFDGQPPLITEQGIDEDGNIIPESEVIVDGNPEGNGEEGGEDGPIIPPLPPQPPRKKYYVKDGVVTIAAENVQIIDETGKLRTIQYSQYVKEQIIHFFPNAEDLQKEWNNLQARKSILEMLENSGISIEQIVEITNQKEADIFDLLCYLAYNLPIKTRKQRAEMLKKNKVNFFLQYSEKAREILDMIIEKYIDYGLNQIKPDIINVEPISRKGNAMEIVNEFGGVEEYKKAIEEIQVMLYAA